MTEGRLEIPAGAKGALWDAHMRYQHVREQSEDAWAEALLRSAYPHLLAALRKATPDQDVGEVGRRNG